MDRTATLLVLLGLALGGAAGWVVGGQFSLRIGAGVLVTGLAFHVRVAQHLASYWGWVLLPLYVGAGWIASRQGWHGALPVAVVVLGLAVGPRAWLATTGKIAPRAAALLIGAAYVALLTGVILGYLPIWCLAAILALPVGVRIVFTEDPNLLKAQAAAFPVVFVGQVVIGLLIQGLVR